MKGLEGVVETVIERLKVAVPGKMSALRQRYNVDPDDDAQAITCPDVVTIAPYDRDALGLEEWPAILVAGLETVSLEQHDVLPGGEEWLVRYRLRAFVWARGEQAPATDLARNRITLGLRELLMQRRTMAADVRVDPRSLRESYSERATDAAQATVSASYIEFEVDVAELLTDVDRPPLGEVGAPPTVDTTHLPPHPAL